MTRISPPIASAALPGILVAFVPKGEAVQPAPGMVVVDVGNDLGPGVLDHHQPGSAASCAARLVVDHPQFVLAARAGAQAAPVTVVTHLAPDFDAVTSVYLCRQLLLMGRVPEHARKLADYANDIDCGMLFRSPDLVETPYGMFTLLCHDLNAAARAGGWNRERYSLACLEAGVRLLDIVMARMDAATDLHATPLFRDDDAVGPALLRLRDDRGVYAVDRDRGERVHAVLPGRDGNAVAVDALLVADPKSLFLRHWARTDRDDPEFPAGYPLLVVNTGNRRFIVSIPPGMPYTLKGLGNALEARETHRREQLGQPRTGQRRKGYDSPDPWYDGRNPYHDYTIIDTPSNGTVLTWDEVRATILDFCAARPDHTDKPDARRP